MHSLRYRCYRCSINYAASESGSLTGIDVSVFDFGAEQNQTGLGVLGLVRTHGPTMYLASVVRDLNALRASKSLKHWNGQNFSAIFGGSRSTQQKHGSDGRALDTVYSRELRSLQILPI